MSSELKFDEQIRNLMENYDEQEINIITNKIIDILSRLIYRSAKSGHYKIIINRNNEHIGETCFNKNSEIAYNKVIDELREKHYCVKINANSVEISW